MEEKNLIVHCNDLCGYLHFVYDEEDGLVYTSYLVPAFYYLQNTAWETFVLKIKLAWAVITGKHYSLFDMIFTKEDFRQIVDFAKRIE